MIGTFIFMCLYLFWLWFCFGSCVERRQKTRSTQQRRAYMGSRQRPSDTQEPTIYVSPANLPPPPKYEAMAPPSYEEVVGIHYPNYQPQIQPITQPITTALAQSSNPENSVDGNGNTSSDSNSNAVSNSNVTSGNSNDVSGSSNVTSGNSQVSPTTIITVTPDDRTTVTVTSS